MAKAKYTQNSRGEWETKIWDGTYNADGSKHRKRLISKKSSADLERQVTRLKNDIENGHYVQNTDIMFIDYANKWLKAKKAVREKNTRKMYKNVIDKHFQFLVGVRLVDIRNSHFQMAINNELEHPRTCQQIYITFKQVLENAVVDHYIGAGMFDSICRDINLPKYSKPSKRTLTQIEKDAIPKANFTEREKAYVYIIYSCGLRRGEALGLSKFDFKFEPNKNTVSITKALIFDGNNAEIKNLPKTDNGFRTLPIPDSTAAYLKEYISNVKGTYLFTCKSGTLISHSSYVKMWNSIVKKMNYAVGGTDAFPKIEGLTAHIFRHNYCTNLCYKVPEISIKKIAALLGDTEKMVMEVYNHIMEEKEDTTAVVNDVLAI